MKRKAIDLDHHMLFAPEEIDFIATDLDVGLGCRELRLSAADADIASTADQLSPGHFSRHDGAHAPISVCSESKTSETRRVAQARATFPVAETVNSPNGASSTTRM